MGLIIFRSETRVVPPGNKLKRSVFFSKASDILYVTYSLTRVDTGKYPEKHSAHWNYIRVLQISISYQPPVLMKLFVLFSTRSPRLGSYELINTCAIILILILN